MQYSRLKIELAYVVISEPPTIPITVSDSVYPELAGIPTKVYFSAEDQSENYILNQATIKNYVGPDYWRDTLITNDTSTWWYLAGEAHFYRLVCKSLGQGGNYASGRKLVLIK